MQITLTSFRAVEPPRRAALLRHAPGGAQEGLGRADRGRDGTLTDDIDARQRRAQELRAAFQSELPWDPSRGVGCRWNTGPSDGSLCSCRANTGYGSALSAVNAASPLTSPNSSTKGGRRHLERRQSASVEQVHREGQMKVLLVEDEALLLWSLAGDLTRAGFDVTSCLNADVALPHLTDPGLAAVITDIRMPGSMDGIGLANYVRANHPHLPVIVVSAEATARHLEGVGEARFTKPIRIAALVETIRKLVEPVADRSASGCP